MKIKIPFINGIGLPNLLIQREWLDCVLTSFIKEGEYNKSTFVDVGVNIGQTLIRLKSIAPKKRYLGFEPNATCVSYTQSLIQKNKFSNCTLQNSALYSKSGIVRLEKSYDVDSRASIISSLRPNYFNDSENVLAIDYSSFYFEDIDFIKIDVEGAELEVIQGMRKAIEKNHPIIVCEVLDSHNKEVIEFTQNRADQLCCMLKSLDYRIIRLILNNSSNIVSYELVDNIQIVQWSLNSLYLNDYIFYPITVKDHVLIKLESILTEG